MSLPHQNPLLQECKWSPLHYTGNSDKTLYTRFEVLTAVNIKIVVFWDLTSRNQIHGFSIINVEIGVSPELLVPRYESTGSNIPEFPPPQINGMLMADNKYPDDFYFPLLFWFWTTCSLTGGQKL